MDEENGANIFSSAEIEELFATEIAQTSPAATTETNPQEGVDNDSTKTEQIDQTKAFAHRLKESTEKARTEEREAIAKSLGYASYDELQKSREKQQLEDKGLDPEQVTPIVEELVKQRLEQDPRMKELETLRKQKVEEFGKKELEEITKLTNGEITSLAQLPREVIDLWKQKGSLKSAYLELEGEKLITKIRSEQSKGSTSHLANPTGGQTTSTSVRHLTDAEKRAWKQFFPDMSDEELNKKTIENKEK